MFRFLLMALNTAGLEGSLVDDNTADSTRLELTAGGLLHTGPYGMQTTGSCNKASAMLSVSTQGGDVFSGVFQPVHGMAASNATPKESLFLIAAKLIEKKEKQPTVPLTNLPFLRFITPS